MVSDLASYILFWFYLELMSLKSASELVLLFFRI